jgi:hypothetical protein
MRMGATLLHLLVLLCLLPLCRRIAKTKARFAGRVGARPAELLIPSSSQKGMVISRTTRPVFLAGPAVRLRRCWRPGCWFRWGSAARCTSPAT